MKFSWKTSFCDPLELTNDKGTLTASTAVALRYEGPTSETGATTAAVIAGFLDLVSVGSCGQILQRKDRQISILGSGRIVVGVEADGAKRGDPAVHDQIEIGDDTRIGRNAADVYHDQHVRVVGSLGERQVGHGATCVRRAQRAGATARHYRIRGRGLSGHVAAGHLARD